jgi:hypothetical protein
MPTAKSNQQTVQSTGSIFTRAPIASLSQLDLSGRSFSVNGTVARALFVADETRLV